MDCVITWRIAGPCGSCGEYQGNGGHATDEGLRCAVHCGLHGAQVSPEWAGEPVTVSGRQGDLFA